MTEQKAIEGCQRQDRISQKYIFDKWSDGMLMVCMRYLKRLPDAEEVMLNGFYNFFRSADRLVYINTASLAAWLKKIMVNECLMHLRKKQEIQIVDEEQGAIVSAADNQLDDISAKELFRLITALPPGYRTVFNLYVVEGYDHKEISALLNISEGTSKSQLSKARAMMQKLVKENMLL